ncbi:hypothetical protein HEP84_27695 [Streptomyces sp. RLB1-33]|uniref:hypothetical protein n=1 Tax=Streptomyces mirabilis TaxID=68239 RepID=UPI00143ED58B|nr:MULTISPECIES: hypothetical protein [Streptomyces]QIY72366.1 hypothetical protein HEP84_27695 [Streptomyces sp. RLB1-33]QUW80685.1 hypothetical protein SMIR_17405 [Streptomyces mirabilis]
MGERLGGDGVPGRRRVRPGGAASDPWEARDAATLETELGAVLLGGQLDPEAERRAVTAFRAAHDAGAHRARTRRRDDWRLPAERRAGRPVKMTLGVVFASLTLGGVAVAAIGSVGSSTDGDGAGRGTAHPSAVAPDQPGGEASSMSSGVPGPTDGPATAQDTEAHCRAYEQVKDRGKALDARAWQRLVTAAGGKDKVAAYCSEQLARATAAPSRTAGNGKAGSAGASSNGTSGGTGNAAGNGQANGKKGGGKHK